MKKIILVFSGPSGAGKSTLIKHLLEKFNVAGLTVSHTTRIIRETEIDGVSYHFVSHAKFAEMVKNNEFVEHVECFGNCYGTSKQAIDTVLKIKNICILDLEYEGAYAILNDKYFRDKCVGILVLPPSYSVLKQRLMARNSETPESLAKRLNDSFKVARIAKYQFVLINTELERSKQKLEAFVSELMAVREFC